MSEVDERSIREGFTVKCWQGCYHCEHCGLPDMTWHDDDCPNRDLQETKPIKHCGDALVL